MSNSSTDLLPNITLTKLKVSLIAQDSLYLPRFSGSAFRGGFGASLRKCCCITQKKSCLECMLKASCVYARIFETAHDHVTDSGYKLSDYPRPFIIEPPFANPNHYNKGDVLVFYLIFMGKAIDYLPYFVFAFSEMGKRGIGSSHTKYKIDTIIDTMDKEERVIFNGSSELFLTNISTVSLHELMTYSTTSNELSINFETPTRIKTKNRLTQGLDFHVLIQNILRRISLLSLVCEDTSLNIDYKALIQQASETVRRKDSKLYWYDWKRYSFRQKDSMKLGGFLGTIVYEGEFHDFLPFIKAGEYLHVGKACTFGLGKYEMK